MYDKLIPKRFIMKEYKLFLFLIIFLIKIQFSNATVFEYNQTNYKYVKHEHSESSYQHAWCSAHDGIEEFENLDKTRVDCLTDTHAVEFDFANKWAESIGQALHYQFFTHYMLYFFKKFLWCNF